MTAFRVLVCRAGEWTEHTPDRPLSSWEQAQAVAERLYQDNPAYEATRAVKRERAA